MQLKNSIFKIIQWWVTPKLPKQHIFIKPENRPKEIKEVVRVYVRKWLIHPIKRRVAKYYLFFLQKYFKITVIGVTGSAGKTTTKEMIASILNLDGETKASFENVDPIYNIPTTILKCRPSTKYLILEMGVEFPGEMDYYLWLAQPDIGVITNISSTHTQFFGDTSGVGKEKIKLVESLPNKGCAVLNKENKFLRKNTKNIKAQIVWFGKGGNVRAKKYELTSNMKTKFTLVKGKSKLNVQISVLGKQFVYNALAAVSVAYKLGVTPGRIKKGLEKFIPLEHRMKIIILPNGAFLLDDSYNNNPEAAKRTIDTFVQIAGKRKTILVFGDMLELGKSEKKYHRLLGKYIATKGIDYLIGVGNASKETVSQAKMLGKDRTFWVENEKKVLPVLNPLIKKNRYILVKGSRSVGLDRVVDLLSKKFTKSYN